MILLPHPPKVISKKENWASFEIEGLYPGYGVTVGNSLRRVLLSSLSGAAITQVKIKGVQHEVSTIPGVLEDVIMIIMNLKQMRFKMHGDEPQKATLKIKGEKKVKGADFKMPTQVELVSKDCHIATLTDRKSELEMEIQIEKGIGYEPVESRKKKKKLEIGVMPIDAIFTPMRRVSYKVENMRVGERTDFDRVNLEIETDGTVEPEEAFAEASEVLVSHFSLMAETFQRRAQPVKEEAVEDASLVRVEDLKLSARTLKVLAGNKIKTVGDIVKKNEKSLLELEGMGDKGIKEIKKALKKLGLELKSE